MKKIFIISIIFLCFLLIIMDNKKSEFENIVDNSAVINNEITNNEYYITADRKLNYLNISDEVKEVAFNYPEFLNVIIDANIKIPIYDNMVPQGITLMGDYILITSYDGDGKNNSVVYVMDKMGNVINTVDLGTKSHVGGIAYDEANELIWIPDNNGVLNAYKALDFIDNKKVKAKYRFNNVSDDLIDFLDDKKKLIAFVTIDEDSIYFGNFAKDTESIVKKYRIMNIDGKISLNYINSFMVPARTQSITFFNKGLKKYMIMSNSYQRRKSSYIKVYEYQENITNYKEEIIQIELPPMLEQSVVNGNSLYTIFESKAKKYSNCPEKIEYICILDVYKIINMN